MIFNIINNNRLFYLFLIVNSVKQILSLEDYNFAGKQNPFIELIFNHVPGYSLYFYEENNQTLLIFNIFPYLNLRFNFKIYSNISYIQQYYENPETGIIFGMDFNYNSTDVNVKNFRGDSLICLINIRKAICEDYIWDMREKLYTKNNGGNNLGYKLLSKYKYIFLIFFYNIFI